MQYVFARMGKHQPRTTVDQYNYATKIPASAAQPGDLVFFGAPYPYHVGIYAGNGLMWDSPRTGKVVSLRAPWTSWVAGRV